MGYAYYIVIQPGMTLYFTKKIRMEYILSSYEHASSTGLRNLCKAKKKKKKNLCLKAAARICFSVRI